VLATGPLARLHDARADLQVVVLTSPVPGHVLETCPGIAALACSERRDGFFAERRYIRAAAQEVAATLEALGTQPQHARFLSLSDRGSEREIARRLRGSFLRQDIGGAGFQGHLSQRIGQAFAPFGLEPSSTPIPYRLVTGLQDEELAQQALESAGDRPGLPTVVLHPGARAPARRSGGSPSLEWGVARYAELARSLVMMDTEVLVSGYGSRERAMARRVALLAGPAIRVLPELAPRVLASLFRRVRVVVSNDTGPLHLAAAAGAACVGIFGPTRPEDSGPIGPTSRIRVLAPSAPGPCETPIPLVVKAVRDLLRS